MSAPALETVVARALARAGLLDARICVGFSGGVDSCVLLDLLARLAHRHPLRLSAVHVDHGLSPDAQRWAAFCRHRCDALGIALRVVEVQFPRNANVEAAARAARYAVFAAQEADAVALAHSLDDQAETILLRLTRGAGAPGLSGMPWLRPLTGASRVVRPLLAVARAEILRHARAAGLAWIEDESNAHPRFDRNYLRHEVLPILERRFPAYRETWARAASNLADAAGLLDDLAAGDAGTGAAQDRLPLANLRALDPARARNLLRWFLVRQGAAPPGRERLDEALRQLLQAGAGSHPEIAFGSLMLRRHAGVVHATSAITALPLGWEVRWRGEEALRLGYGLGTLHLVAARGSGLSERRLLEGAARVVVRGGGERLKPSLRQPSRTLKNLLREAGVPPWQRSRLPALCVGGQLAWVARLGLDCRFAAQPGEPGRIPRWVPENQ